MSLGYTVNNTGQCPCSHESYILERETDNNQIKLPVVMKVTEEMKLGHVMESDCSVGRRSRGTTVIRSTEQTYELMALELRPQHKKEPII